MSAKRYVANMLVAALPPTRLWRAKSRIWRWANVQADPSCRIVSSVRIWTSGPVSFGPRTFIGHQTFIAGGDAGIVVGADVSISSRVAIVTGTHKIDPKGAAIAGEGFSRPITIHDGSWIGVGAIILGGVTVGRKSVVGAGAVVTKDVPDHAIVVGNPARPLKSAE